MPKVLSVRQPWASMIVRGLKRFEIRSWNTAYRGQLIIHASSAAPTRAFADEVFDGRPELGELMAKIGMHSLEDLRALPRSAIVGMVTLRDVLTIEAVDGVATNDDAAVIGDLNDEVFYWLLSDVVEIQPLTGIDGKLNLWELPSAQEKTVRSRVSRGSPASFRSDAEGAAIAEWSDDDEADRSDGAEPDRFVPTPELAAVIGAGPYTGTEVAQKVWAYIEKHGLQYRRKIRADTALAKVLGCSEIGMHQMTDKIFEHLS